MKTSEEKYLIKEWERLGMINPKQKGKSGEDEACSWISENIYLKQRTITRNYNQMYIGADIVDYPLIYEVKRREALALDHWWGQIYKVKERLLLHNKQTIPVVMFRQNRRRWEFLISAEVIGGTGGWIRLNEVRFKEWAKRYVKE